MSIEDREICIKCKDRLCFLRKAENSNKTIGDESYNFYEDCQIGKYTLQIWRVNCSSSFSQKYTPRSEVSPKKKIIEFHSYLPNGVNILPQFTYTFNTEQTGSKNSPAVQRKRQTYPPVRVMNSPYSNGYINAEEPTWQMNFYRNGEIVLPDQDLELQEMRSWFPKDKPWVELTFNRNERCKILSHMIQKFDPNSLACPMVNLEQ